MTPTRNSAPATAWPFASNASAASWTVAPTAVRSAAGDTVTEFADRATVTATLPDAAPALAVIVAVPLPAAVTRPAASTVATASSLDSHENSAPATAWPFASNASAASWTVAPTAVRSAAGETATEFADWATVTATVPDADPAVAVTDAVPLPTAVTSPVELTVATAVSALDQVTVAPAITCPFWSRTSAESCIVAPSAASSAVAELAVTVVGRGGSGGGGKGSVVPSPQAYANRAVDTVAATKLKAR